LRAGNSNPGLGHALRHEAKEWPVWDIPVIVRLAAADLDGYARLAARLEGVEGVSGLEIRLPVDNDTTEELSGSVDVVAALCEATLLPLLVMLPLPAPKGLPEMCLQAGADALVVAAPVTGAVWDAEVGSFYSGDWYGLGVMPQVLHEVRRLAAQVRAPVIARGGIQSAEEAIAYLRAGAKAVQVDSVILRQPTMPWQIASDLEKRLSADVG
jgi:dihydroorotate dehydrogenase (NAD+) catalytic subunit